MTGDALASQPTLSRFEHAMSPRALYGMGRMLASTVIAQHRHRLNGHAQRLTIDLDPTTTRRMGSKSWRSSTGITTHGATCRWWPR